MSVLVYTVSKLEVLFVDYVNWHIFQEAHWW